MLNVERVNLVSNIFISIAVFFIILVIICLYYIYIVPVFISIIFLKYKCIYDINSFNYYFLFTSTDWPSHVGFYFSINVYVFISY